MLSESDVRLGSAGAVGHVQAEWHGVVKYHADILRTPCACAYIYVHINDQFPFMKMIMSLEY